MTSPPENESGARNGIPTPTPPPPPSASPPAWDLLTFKLAGFGTLTVGLLDPLTTGDQRDWRVIGLGAAMLGGRELMLKTLDAIAGRRGS